MTLHPREEFHQQQQQQVDLVDALPGRIEIPAEFDETQVAAAAQARLRKRGDDIKGAWPALASYLGKRFFNLFSVFLGANSTLQPDAIADGYLFTIWLSSRERLPADVIVAVRRHEAQKSGRPRLWWQPDRQKFMFVWRWRGRARNATLG